MTITEANDKCKKLLKVNQGKIVNILMTKISKSWKLDINKLDEIMHQRGYREETNGSLKNYILKIYGKEATDFINEIL